LLIAWVAFAQVLSFQGLVLWVVGGSLLGGLTVGVLAYHHRRFLALLAMVALPVLVAGATEVVGGTSAGPITRASLMATAAAGSMAVILMTRYPAFVLAPSVMVLSGALGLGAADRVLWLSGVWAVAAAMTVAMLGPYRKEHLRNPSRLMGFSAYLVVVGLVAVATMWALSFFLTDPWTMPGSGPTTATTSAPETASQSLSDAGSTESVASAALEATIVTSLLRWVLLAIVIVLALALLVAVVWRLVVAARWRLLRLRLQRGTPRERALGAWTWLRLQRTRRDQPLPASVSPDVAVSWARSAGDADVLTIARICGPIAFDAHAHVSYVDTNVAWQAARRARKGWSRTWRARITQGYRTPKRVRRRGLETAGLHGAPLPSDARG